MRYLAIDYGKKRIGLAVCDADETIASPLTVLTSRGSLIADIVNVVKDEQIDAVIVGLPINMDDTEGPQAKRTRDFARQLEKQIDIPLHFHDERLSSFDARQKLIGLDLTRKKKKKHIDAIAAATILDCFLEKKHARDDT